MILCILQKEKGRGWIGLRLNTAIMVYHQTHDHNLSARSWSQPYRIPGPNRESQTSSR